MRRDWKKNPRRDDIKKVIFLVVLIFFFILFFFVHMIYPLVYTHGACVHTSFCIYIYIGIQVLHIISAMEQYWDKYKNAFRVRRPPKIYADQAREKVPHFSLLPLHTHTHTLSTWPRTGTYKTRVSFLFFFNDDTESEYEFSNCLIAVVVVVGAYC